MKKTNLLFIFSLIVLLGVNAFASRTTTFEKADALTKARLTLYLESQGQIIRGQSPVEILDEDQLELQVIKHKGTIYEYIKVYISDAEQGPLYRSNSLRLVGGNNDGDFFLFKNKYIDVSSVKEIETLTFSKASDLVKTQMVLYLLTEGLLSQGQNPTDAFDNGELSLHEVIYKGEVYDYIQIYSGDTEAGPLFKKGSLRLLGGNGDGDFYLTDRKWISFLNESKLKGTLVCNVSSMYLAIDLNLEINLADENLFDNGRVEDEWLISWSASECEDSSNLAFDYQEFEALLSGKEKTIYGTLTHSEPDVEMTATVSCHLKP